MSYAYPSLNLTIFLDNLHTLQQQSVKVPLQPLDLNSDTVTLTTAHKAKGLEWSHVYIYRCVDKKWGNSRSYQLLKLPSEILEFSSSEDPNQEERRLFYVSLTRSKQHLTIVSASQYQTSTGTRPALPSLFISDLPSLSVRQLKTTTFENKNKTLLKEFFSPSSNLTLPSSEKKYLLTIIQNFKLSVTALNTYLDCPYKFKLNNLYRIPRTKDAYLAFGYCCSPGLRRLSSSVSTNRQLPSKIFSPSLKKTLEKEITCPTKNTTLVLNMVKRFLALTMIFTTTILNQLLRSKTILVTLLTPSAISTTFPLLVRLIELINLHLRTQLTSLTTKTGAPKNKRSNRWHHQKTQQVPLKTVN